MERYTSLLMAFGLLFSLACGDDDMISTPDAGDDAGQVDAGDDAGDAGGDAGDDGGPDAGDDAGLPQMSYLYGPCVQDDQCPGEGAYCRLPEDGFNMGTCSVECASRTPCDDGTSLGFCLGASDHEGNVCIDACRNSVDCGRESYVCVDVGRIPGEEDSGACIGICQEDADCGEGAECNEESAQCVAEGTAPTMGARTHEACETDADCMGGSCTPEYIDGEPTGELGGACQTFCAIPLGYQNSTFYLGDTLPSGDCPNPDHICIPSRNTSIGSQGSCFDDCVTDDDCREGRTCLRTIADHEFTNGVCIVADCLNGYTCPDDYRCRPVDIGGTFAGRCIPREE